MFSCRNFGFKLDNKKDLDYVYLIINCSNNFFNFEIETNISTQLKLEREELRKKLNRNLKMQASINSSVIFLIGKISMV